MLDWIMLSDIIRKWTILRRILLQCVSIRRTTTIAELIATIVLHPGIRMSWIYEHWEDDYIEDAKAKIRSTVHFYYPNSCGFDSFQLDDGIQATG